ncbi:HAD family hydrolase [Acidaminococcus timonensis]|uniref:HAD family hydrolase n=1 Tax=Acidaminococcus timonensis TaxID=1871002 RepID=UPI002942FF19|nr:HAD family hydrolase [Acidaminococcus timonensis]
MRKKYFFFDIDRTLGLGITRQVPPDTQYCVDELQREGHFVALATGRIQCDAAAFAEKHGIHSLVADGGNSLTVDGRILEMEGLPLAPAKALLHELEDRKQPWSVVLDNTLDRYTPYADYPREDPHNYMDTKVQPVDIDSLPVIYKIMYAREKPGEAQPDRQNLPHLPFIDNTWLVEPVDKGAGIERLMHRLGADPHDAVVFGDGLNDITMFRKPFFGVAMGNARPVIKERADYVTDDNDKGGILNACRKFGWITK